VFENFTMRARMAVVASANVARERNHHEIGTEHLLLGLVTGDDDPINQVLRSAGIEATALRDVVDELAPPGSTPPGAHIPFTAEAKQALERSLEEAHNRGHQFVDAEHLLFALTRDPDATSAKVFRSSGISIEMIQAQLEQRWRTSENPDS
jgi:ATP-dependent Clp protease ATP-binding subunit ClpC